jgi:hypothetical protein
MAKNSRIEEFLSIVDNYENVTLEDIVMRQAELSVASIIAGKKNAADLVYVSVKDSTPPNEVWAAQKLQLIRDLLLKYGLTHIPVGSRTAEQRGEITKVTCLGILTQREVEVLFVERKVTHPSYTTELFGEDNPIYPFEGHILALNARLPIEILSRSGAHIPSITAQCVEKYQEVAREQHILSV